MLCGNQFLRSVYKYKRKLINNISNCKQLLRNRVHTNSKRLSQHPNILFFGTDNFSLPSLKKLYINTIKNTTKSKVGVVTSFKSPANCVRLYAEKEKLTLFSWPVSSDDCRHYDLGIVVSFGHLIPEKIINAFPLGMINVHASLLPKWRGAAPIIYSIMNGDSMTGVTVMRIEPKRFDVGDILAQRKIPIKEDIFMPELHEQLATEGSNLLISVVNNFVGCLNNSIKQNNEVATYAPKISPSIIEVNWSDYNAETVYRRYRSLFSFKYLTTRFQTKIVQLVEVRLPSRIDISNLNQPGEFFYNRSDKCLTVKCSQDSYIQVHQLRIEGKKIMSAVDFNNGFLKKLHITEFHFSNI